MSEQQAEPSNSLILVGLVQAKEGLEDAFREWYLGNHVEDTYHCPVITSARCFEASLGFMGEMPSGYITFYEFTGDDAETMQAALGAYQADPDGWAQRLPNNNSMEVVGAGWYNEVLSFGPKQV